MTIKDSKKEVVINVRQVVNGLVIVGLDIHKKLKSLNREELDYSALLT